MKDSTVLRTARVGGFNKEDVLTYVDELNAKIDSLKKELDTAKANSVDPSELDQYKNEIARLNKLLEESNEKLAAAESNNERINKEIAQLTMDYEAEKQSFAAEKNRLEIELENEKAKPTQPSEPVVSYVPADTSNLESKISELESRLSELNNDLSRKENQISGLERQLKEKENEIDKLKLDLDEMKLNSDDSSFSGGFDMGALFSEAQATAKKIIVEARMAADRLVSDARNEADKIHSNASADAEITERNAVKNAEKTKADAVKAATDTVKNSEYAKSLMRKEIDSLRRHFDDFASTIGIAAEKSAAKIAEAQEILNKAHDVIDGESEMNSAIDELRTSASERTVKPEIPSINEIGSIEKSAEKKEDPYIVPVLPKEETYSAPPATEIKEAHELGNILPEYDDVDLYGDFELPDELAKFAIADEDIEAAEAAEKKKPSVGIAGLDDLSSLAELAEAAESEI